jgi:hypothetical protein
MPNPGTSDRLAVEIVVLVYKDTLSSSMPREASMVSKFRGAAEQCHCLDELRFYKTQCGLFGLGLKFGKFASLDEPLI